MPHDFELDHIHENESNTVNDLNAQSIWDQDHIELTTVGIDIGSSTSHLVFAKVLLKRLPIDLSNRFVTIRRRIIHSSKIIFTPFKLDNSIDAQAIEEFIHSEYKKANLTFDDIDSGAVILTGEAIKKTNASLITNLFSKQAGKFVCATAGHRLEAILAAHGSGACSISRKRFGCGLHVDIGGGTTKFALVDKGNVVSVSAFAVGGRILSKEDSSQWLRIDDSAKKIARDIGFEPTSSGFSNTENFNKFIQRTATLIVEKILDQASDDLGESLELTPTLTRSKNPEFLSFSGGVAEYLFNDSIANYGDISKDLAKELITQLKNNNLTIPIIEPIQKIRATVIGASQFSVQVSGNTIYATDKSILPIRNIPIIRLEDEILLDLDSSKISVFLENKQENLELNQNKYIGIAFNWFFDPEYNKLILLAKGIATFLNKNFNKDQTFFIFIQGDIAASLGHLLKDDLGIKSNFFCIDGISLNDLDFIDVGKLIDPPGVLPIVIKSLIFT